MNKSILLTKPLKKIPQILISNPMNGPTYKMYDLKSNRIVGRMIAHPFCSRFGEENTLFIRSLIISQQRKGFGTKFLDFATHLSKEKGLGGRLELLAATTNADPLNPPHIFYRKYGFTTDDKKLLKKIDRYIRLKKQLSYKTTPPRYMYYRPEDIGKAKISIIEKFKAFFYGLRRNTL
ncbi:GNAT family N-acetyltransferase [bacterium]|nr:GNAT family N-acetyltransferase [bacterium]